VDVSIVHQLATSILHNATTSYSTQAAFQAVISDKDIDFDQLAPGIPNGHDVPLAKLSPHVRSIIVIGGHHALAARDFLRNLCIVNITCAEERIRVASESNMATADNTAMSAEARKEILKWRDVESRIQKWCVGFFNAGMCNCHLLYWNSQCDGLYSTYNRYYELRSP
jgi:hypothetical protein